MTVRSSLGLSRYTVAADYDVVFGNRLSWRRGQPQGIIYCHSAGSDLLATFVSANQRNLMRAGTPYATVHAGDLGGEAWGNDTSITRVGEAVAYLRSEWGQVGPVALVGLSMGALTALNYAYANPDEVACVAVVIPALDLADLMLRGVSAGINAAYGGAYNDVTDGPDHSPVQYAAALPPTLPIRLWTSSNDTYAVPATATAFVADCPWAIRTDLGAVGHSAAVMTTPVIDAIVEWVSENLP